MLGPPMNSTSRTTSRWGWPPVILALGLLPGCNKQPAATEAPASGGDGAAADSAGPHPISPSSDLESLQRDLEARAQELADVTDEQHGVPASATERCTRVCQLEAAICDISDAICGLAEEHPDEPRYADSCTDARQECGRAEEACRACSG